MENGLPVKALFESDGEIATGLVQTSANQKKLAINGEVEEKTGETHFRSFLELTRR